MLSQGANYNWTSCDPLELDILHQGRRSVTDHTFLESFAVSIWHKMTRTPTLNLQEVLARGMMWRKEWTKFSVTLL